MTAARKPAPAAPRARRRELLDTAAEVFADQGYNATTVRKIADHAGMLAGSLYYHFDSKESMLEEILRTFLDELWDGYDTVLGADLGPRETLEALVTESFREIDRHRAAVAIYQKESKQLVAQERFAFLQASRSAGSRRRGCPRWSAGSPPRCSGPTSTSASPTGSCATPCGSPRPGTGRRAASPEEIARQYLSMVLDGSPYADRPVVCLL
ncbi:TetR/AcrR family transcriptional regulator OS=Streptomyces alboniger OX=132473 GN=CP975_30855 PE=4 SV=1 [Streptomyces alboniger]